MKFHTDRQKWSG